MRVFHISFSGWSFTGGLSDSYFPQVSRTLLCILAVLNNAVVWMVYTRPPTSKLLLLYSFPSFSHLRLLMVSHRSLSESKSPQVSRTLLCILAVLNNAVVWMVYTRPPTSKLLLLYSFPSFSHLRLLMVSHRSLSESKSPQVSRTLLCILAVLNNAVVWMVYTRPPTSKLLLLYSFPSFSHLRLLMVSHRSLSESKSPQVSRTLLCILAVLNNAVVWMVYTRPPTSKLLLLYSFPSFSHLRLLMVSHRSLSESKSPQVSRTLLCILAVLNNAVVWMVYTRPPTSKLLLLYSFPSFSHLRLLMVSHRSLSESKSPQVSRTLLCILAVLNNAVVWMVYTRPPTSKLLLLYSFPSFSHLRLLMVSHRSLSESKSPQVSRTPLRS